MVHDSLETSIKAKDTMWIKHVYGQQLQYQPEKKKMNTVDSVLQHTAITKDQRIPIPDEVFARDENQKSRNVENKTKTFFFFDHFCTHTFVNTFSHNFFFISSWDHPSTPPTYP